MVVAALRRLAGTATRLSDALAGEQHQEGALHPTDRRQNARDRLAGVTSEAELRQIYGNPKQRVTAKVSPQLGCRRSIDGWCNRSSAV